MRALPAIAAACLAASGCLGDRDTYVQPRGDAIPARASAVPVRIQAAHNSDTLFLRVRFPAPDSGTRHEAWRRTGDWRLEGGGFRDLQAAVDGDEERGDVTRVSAAYETALSVLVDDPSSAGRLLNFREQGCFGQCHEFQRQMPNWRTQDGYEPMRVWTGVGKGDLWIWRGQRSALAGFADDLSFTSAGYVPDAGNAPFSAVALSTTSSVPTYLFDPDDAGDFAASWAALPEPFAFDDGTLDALPDAMTLASALALGYVAQDDDAVPAYRLSMPTGSRADVGAASVQADGMWDVVLTRKLSTGDATGDLAFVSGNPYQIALALHSDAADGRDHYVSLPVSLLIGTAGEGVTSVAVSGTGATAPSFTDEAAFPVTELALFLPGVTSFDWLVGAPTTRDGAPRSVDVVHGGAFEVASAQWRCSDCHTVRSTDAVPPVMDAGPLERLPLRRGGVFGPTPFFEETP